MFLSPPGHSEQEGVAVGRNQNGFAEPVAGWRHALATRVAQGVEGKIDRRARREWLRVLKVSDARYDGETVIEPVRVLSLRRGDDSFYLKEQVLLECIPAGATLTCSLTLDRGLLAEFRGRPPFADLDDLVAQVTAFSGRVLDDEFHFFDGLRGAEVLDEFYDTTDADLRLGYGSGLPATTIHLSLPEPVRFRVRDEVFRMHRESRFFPKSRKVTVTGERPVAPLGWIRAEVE